MNQINHVIRMIRIARMARTAWLAMPRRRDLALVFLGAMVVLAGCQTAKTPKRKYRDIGLAAFAAPPIPENVEPTDDGAADTALREIEEDLDAADDWSDDSWDEEEAEPDGLPLEPGERALVDSMVGQINGQPIFADAFFAPIEDQLIALSRRATPQEFSLEAEKIVRLQLQQEVLNALFIAEARGDLSQEEKVGILGWLRNLQEQVVAQSGGNRVETERRLRQEEGTSLEGYLEEIEDRALIQKLLAEKIQPRVIVSWRDIAQEYQRQYTKFNPPGSMTISRIALSKSRTEDIETVKTRLAAGDDFLEIAESVGIRRTTFQTVPLDAEGSVIVEKFRENETLKTQILLLKDQGDVTEAFEFGNFVMWLHATEVERPPGRSLYDGDVQRQLSAYISAQRGGEEQRRYIDSLLEEGIYDEMETMALRLIRFALIRYAPS